MCRGCWELVSLAVLLVSTAGAVGAATPASQSPALVWSGDVHLDGSTHVAADTTLRIEPGTRLLPAPVPGLEGREGAPELVVHGDLLVPDGPGPPVEFRLPVAVEGSAPGPTVIHEAVFHPTTNPSCALRLASTTARIHDSQFTGASNGLCVGSAEAAVEEARPAPSRSPLAPAPSTRTSTLSSGAVPPLSEIPGSQDPHEPAGPQRDQGESPTVVLDSTRYVDNAGTGLNLSGASNSASADGLLVRSTGERVEGNDVGIHTGSPDTRLEFANGTIQNNRIGLRSEGGSTELDHATFRANEEWDVYQAGEPSDVRWSGSYVEPSCVHVEGHGGYGCQRGAVGGVTVLTILLGVLYSLAFLISEAGGYLVTRVWLWVRLYSRIPRDELLDHEVRRQLFEFVRADPGRHLRDLAREVGGYGRTVYHLRRLEKEGFLQSRREGFYLRFYPSDADPDEREPLSVRERVLDAIERTPGIHASEIARRLDTSRQLVSYHVSRLLEEDRIERRTRERVIGLHPNDGA